MVITPEHVQYAGFWRRLLATLIDSLLYAIVIYLAIYLLYGADYFTWAKENSEPFAFYGMGDMVLNNIAPIVVTIFFWLKFMGTPGKLLLGCHVVDATTFAPLRPGQAILRYFAYLVSILPLGLGFLWIIWDRRKQGFHDKIAKSVVIMEDETHEMLTELKQEPPR